MWPNPPETADLVTFTEEILIGKFHFLCSVKIRITVMIYCQHNQHKRLLNYKTWKIFLTVLVGPVVHLSNSVS